MKTNTVISKNLFLKSITPISLRKGCELNWGRTHSAIYHEWNLSDLEPYKTKIYVYNKEIDGYEIDGYTFIIINDKVRKTELCDNKQTRFVITYGRS